MKIRATEYKKIIEENIEMSKKMSEKDWKRFREWCGYYELRWKLSGLEWRILKNKFLKEWLDESI
jgi:hypothetical protein